MAYNIRPEQSSRGPLWTDSDEYTVIAKAPRRPYSIERSATGVDGQTPAGPFAWPFHLELKQETRLSARFLGVHLAGTVTDGTGLKGISIST